MKRRKDTFVLKNSNLKNLDYTRCITPKRVASLNSSSACHFAQATHFFFFEEMS